MSDLDNIREYAMVLKVEAVICIKMAETLEVTAGKLLAFTKDPLYSGISIDKEVEEYSQQATILESLFNHMEGLNLD